MVALALMVSCMPSAYTISASEAFGDGTEDIFTDGEITSEPAAEESTPDVSSADQEKTEQAQQSTLTYENDSVKVTAEALEDGALPQNTALKADSVNENSSVSYDTVSQKLSAAATDKGSSLRGFFAYDVYFADGDGNRVEPNGRVRVTFEYKTPAAPELTDAASTSVTVEKLHYNSSTGDTDVNTLQANEDLKVLNVNEGKQIQTLQVETGNAAVFAVMWDSPETADVEAEAVSGNEDEASIASEELTDGMDISDEPEQDAAETPAAENPEVTPDAEPTEAPAENPDVVEEPAEDIASPEDVPAADENGETSLIEVLGDDTNLRVSPSIEAEVLATVNAGTQLTLLDTVTAEDGATWYKVSWEGTEAYIRSDMAQVVDSSDEAEEPEDVLESEEVSYSQEVGNVVVTATAAKGVIPEGAQFVVTPIEKGSDQYADIEKQLHEGAENESYTVAGFLAYDISFLNDDGTKIEPQNGSVRVSIAYKEAEIPEDVAETDTAQENMNVSLVHFVEDANGNVTEVVNMSNDGQAKVSTTDNGEIESANFETESFSTFSVVWLADDFTSVQTTSSYDKETTVDSAERGITINMFDYDTDKINAGHPLQFSDGTHGVSEDYNKYRGPADLSTGIMQKKLGQDSYPIVDKGNKESSSYLFSTKEGTGKEFYSGANYLFKQDANGYYEYDSAKNFAQFNKNTKKFTVYNVPGSSKDPIDLQQPGPYHGSFFPFNTLGDKYYNGIPQISENSPDFHFGMTMSAKFIQPKDGKIKGNNMVFEFSGDDDVWVYIDGVLVLDIGGIHNVVSGSIDFAEGTVKVGSNNYTLKNLFKEAGAEKEGDFVSRKDIFKDYTVHTINFYYLERGKGDSNCKLKFNLPTVPDGSVKVQKQLSNTDKEKYADVKFKFQLLVKDEKENYVPSTPNGILDDGRKVEFSEDKVFTLKPGQYATFSGLKANTKYRIKELGVSKNEYDKVFINDKVMTTSQDGNVISDEATVGSKPLVIFTNKCSENNSRKLCITKKIKGDIPVNDKFNFEIKLNGQRYTGNYYLQDSEGKYYTSKNGTLEETKEKTVCGKAVNGVVSSVPAGYTVVLEQILAGTSFEVNEINLDANDYGNPEYSIDKDKAEDVNTTNKASGKIKLGNDAKVTVTNTRNDVASLEIKKVNTSKQPLSGAKFTLTLDNDQAKTYNVTSDKDGLLKFENLSVGTYTLTETEAPSDYVKSTESYKVIVSPVENNKATAKLYKADDTNEIENKQIINYTEKEEAENNLTSSKTAEVVDYENRIYKINLNAETTGREGDVEAQGASVVMVLDASKSMNENISNTNTTKLAALKNAANTFIDTLKSKSPESEIAIIWYSGSEGGSTSITNPGFEQLNEQGVSNLKGTISSKNQGSDGTPMGVALEKAKDQLSGAHHENKYVVFMTDGLPGYQKGNDNWNCMVANNAVNNANSIKEQATLYTVGVGLNDAGSFNWKLGHSDTTSSDEGHGSMSGSEFLSKHIATQSSDGKQYAYDTNGLNDLVNTFNVIAGSIGDLFTVQPKEIVDVIDARFKLTDDGLKDLATNRRLGTGSIKTNNNGSKEIIWTDRTTGSEVGKVTIVEQADGTTKITWTGQAARIGNAATENKNDKGWNASFRIQAKDDFIGGNMIPTNGADSGIYLDGGGIKKFEQPSVNVKLLNLNIGNKKITVFKGDPITAKNFGNELAETIKVVQLNKKETLTAVEPMDAGKNSVKLPDLEDADINKLNTDKELTIGSKGLYQYIYPGSNDAVGYFTYTYKIVKGNAKEHLADSVGEKVEEYQLTVTYHPYSKGVRNQKLATYEPKIKEPDVEVYTAKNAPKTDLVGEPKGGSSVDSSVASTGTYTVNVIAGELQIVKKLDAQAEKEETFEFTITSNDKVVATATATIGVGGKEANAVFTLADEDIAKLESGKKKLSELSRGDYVVKESSDNTSYELQSIVTGEGTNCDSAIAEDLSNGITFTMGTDKKQNKVPQNGNTTDGRVGIAEFTNKKTVVNIDFEKVDAETNTKKLSGAEFDLYKANTDGEQTGDPIKQYESGRNGKVSIENLPIGNYVLVERKAPAGYQLSAKPWKIIVGSDRNITVTHGEDTVSPNGNEKIYQLTNAKLYSLPESGGPGTYGFTISGVAILATALLLFINNKRREEEAKRS